MDLENDIQQCLQILKAGGTILYPTDTIWGIGCDATNASAVEKIKVLKNRPDEKSFIILVADERDVLKHVASADLRVFDYIHQQTKPVTIIYEDAIGLADNLISADGSIAIRICHDEFCKHPIRRFRKPIVSTSANLSGQPSPATFASISTPIINGVDYVVKHRQDDNSPRAASSIVRWNKSGTPIVIRS